MSDLDNSTGNIYKECKKIFMQDTDPEDDANPGDEWQNSSNVIKIRKYDSSGWITVGTGIPPV